MLMKMEDTKGVPFTRVPDNKRGKVRKKYLLDDGETPLVQVRDWDGEWIWVPIPEITHREVSESYYLDRWFIYSTVPSNPGLKGITSDQCAYAEISALGFSVVMPVKRNWIRIRDPKTGKRYRNGDIAERLAFKGYLFVGMSGHLFSDEGLHKLAECRHVEGMIMSDRKPLFAPGKEMERFFNGINDGLYDETRKVKGSDDSLQCMDLIEVLDGPFAQFTGVVKKVTDHSDGENRWQTAAQVELMIFGRETPATFPIDSIKRIGVAE